MVFDVVSGSIGTAGVAIQVFQTINTAYGYFEDAAHMPEDCASLRLRLLFEYTRLLDWGDAAGLADPEDHARFDAKLRANRPLIFAALSEMQTRLQRLTAIKGSYKELQNVDESFTVQATAEIGVTSNATMRDAGQSRVNLHERSVVEPSDLHRFQAVFDSQDLSVSKAKHSKGVEVLLRMKQAAKAVGEVATHPKRLWWALRDKEEFEKQLGKLKDLTDFLHESLGDTKMQALLESSRETCLAMVQLNGHIAELKVLLIAARLSSSQQAGGSDDASLYSDSSTLVEGRSPSGIPALLAGSTTSFEQLTKFRLHHSEIYTRTRHTSDIHISFDKLQIPLTNCDMHRTTGSLLKRSDDPQQSSNTSINAERVWVEWKNYEEINLGVAKDGFTPIEGPAPDVQIRVEQLVMLLREEDQPIEFRIPRCLGYCQDEKRTRFGFVYELPMSAPAPQTLYELLGQSQASLRSRIATAKNLATSLLFLHAVGWLHKDLRSANIIFLDGPCSPDLPELRLGGFEYARPDRQDLTTTSSSDEPEGAVYRHPEYQGVQPRKSYRKSYDFYSLGLVLIELAYWKPAGEIFGTTATERVPSTSTKVATGGLAPATLPDKQSQSADPRSVRDRILQDQQILETVRLAMGERYCSAVRACITGLEAFDLPHDAEETDPIVSTMLQLAFLRLVVDVLRSIIV